MPLLLVHVWTSVPELSVGKERGRGRGCSRRSSRRGACSWRGCRGQRVPESAWPGRPARRRRATFPCLRACRATVPWPSYGRSPVSRKSGPGARRLWGPGPGFRARDRRQASAGCRRWKLHCQCPFFSVCVGSAVQTAGVSSDQWRRLYF